MLKIGLITDIHNGPRAYFKGHLRKMGDQALELTRAFVEEMNHTFKPDLVLNLGDMVQDVSHAVDLENYDAAWDILRTLDAPMFPVVGNHDLIEMSLEDVRARWLKLPNMAGTQVGSASQLHYFFEHSGFRFVVLHTSETKDSHIWIDDVQWAWLPSALTSESPVIVVMHHSAADQDTAGNLWFKNHPHLALVDRREQLRALFEKHAVRAVWNGHLHWNQQTTHQGISYTTFQSLIENMTGGEDAVACGAWTTIELQEGGFRANVRGLDAATFDVTFGAVP